MFNPRLLAGSILLIFLLAGCASSPGVCPPNPYADLSGVAAFAGDDTLLFRFPLDEVSNDASPSFTYFSANSDGPESTRKHHAAEDFFHPAGTPVYAVADGKVSFSGSMGGYGWLVIIDHPQANLYSLYGHLSPSRWRIEPGPVEKGELIAYLGDSHENGGTLEQPLEPHLHLGLRAGQRADYSPKGELRWMAGWIKPCPQDVGWLQPSEIIASQGIPLGGFPQPAVSFLANWGIEVLFTAIYLIGGMSMLVFAIKKDKPLLIIFSGVVLLATGWFFNNDGWKMSYALFAVAILLLTVGIYKLVRQ
jgi:murein DD-endopeptidase MepM/ murein hydrolase activator NlpD